MTIKSVVGSLAAYALKRAYNAGKAIEIPSFRNVSPDGAGWYRWNGSKWERSPGDNSDGEGWYLSQQQLVDFAIEAIRVTK